MRALMLALVLAMPAMSAALAQSADSCGDVIAIETHAGSTTRYALMPVRNAKLAVVLLIGGSGRLALDDQGCPRALRGNSLVRSLPHFHAAEIATALVDVPSDFSGEDGLAGFRNTPLHAEALGKVIADVRARTNAAVWVIGHSRGTISAANAVSRLPSPPAAPDGAALLSAMMVGDSRARKVFAAQTVFDLPLAAITKPLLVVGHEADNCVRSPPGTMDSVAAKAGSTRKQAVAVTGGPIAPGRPPSLAACEVTQPHDFVGQEADLAAGIVRFMRGGSF